MKFYYVLWQGGLWGNVPGFTLQGYRDKKDFKPEMTVEMKRAGRVSVWHKHSSEGGSWKVTRKIPGGGEMASEALGTQLQSPEDWVGASALPATPSPSQHSHPMARKGQRNLDLTCTAQHVPKWVPACLPPSFVLWPWQKSQWGL